MKKREFVYILLAIFFIGCGSPGEFNANVTVKEDPENPKEKDDALKDTLSESDDNKSKDELDKPTCKSLPKTGQTSTHQSNDDGDLQIGVDRSYTRDEQNQIVADDSIGLMWQDNESVKKPWVTQENYVSGKYLDTSGDTAATYCKNLRLDKHEDWRLPTGDELYYLVDRGAEKPSIDYTFKNTLYGDNNSYWSSTTSKTSSKAWSVNFEDGYDSDEDKNSSFFVRCVRGGSKIDHNFVRDHSKKVVNDTKTCLMWQDDTNARTVKESWENAMKHCNNLVLAKLDDWRAPNINELNSIRDINGQKKAINSAFINTAINGYWSSTTQSDWANFAWTIYSDSGYTADDEKSNIYSIRCVRSGE